MSRARASSHLRSVAGLAAPASGRAPAALGVRDDATTFSATVTSAEGELLVVPRHGGPPRAARLAHMAGYSASVGDVVMIVRDEDELVVVAVLEPKRPLSLAAPDGTRASIVGGAIEIADADGRLLLRYGDGGLELAPQAGDLRLAAPAGRVCIEAGFDVAIAARRDVTIAADRAAALQAGPADVDLASSVRVDGRGASVVGSHVDVTARATRVTSGDATVVARDASVSATRIRTAATRIETTAEHVVMRAKSMAQDVAGLLESKVGRARTLVKGAFSLRSKSTSMKSQEDTSVDGRRVLLG